MSHWQAHGLYLRKVYSAARSAPYVAQSVDTGPDVFTRLFGMPSGVCRACCSIVSSPGSVEWPQLLSVHLFHAVVWIWRYSDGEDVVQPAIESYCNALIFDEFERLKMGIVTRLRLKVSRSS